MLILLLGFPILGVLWLIPVWKMRIVCSFPVFPLFNTIFLSHFTSMYKSESPQKFTFYALVNFYKAETQIILYFLLYNLFFPGINHCFIFYFLKLMYVSPVLSQTPCHTYEFSLNTLKTIRYSVSLRYPMLHSGLVAVLVWVSPRANHETRVRAHVVDLDGDSRKPC